MIDKQFELQNEKFLDPNYGLFNYDSLIPHLYIDLVAVNRTFYVQKKAIIPPEFYRKDIGVFCPLERGYLKINKLI